MSADLQGLHVICNWNERALDIIRELCSDVLQVAGEFPQIRIISDVAVDLAEQVAGDEERFKEVEIIRGDPCDWKVLDQIDAATAKSVTILADETFGEYTDSNTMMMLLAFIQCLEKKATHENDQAHLAAAAIPTVLAEFIGTAGWSRERSWRATASDKAKFIRDRLGTNLQILNVDGVRSRIFAQQARSLKGGLVAAYNSLLSFKPDDCEIYRTKVDHRPSWQCFSDIVESFLGSPALDGRPMIPTSLELDGKFQTNPKDKLPERHEHELLVMSYAPPPSKIDLGEKAPGRLTGGGRSAHVAPAVYGVIDQEDGEMKNNPQAASGTPAWVMRGHYVICHWNDRAPEIIAELRRHEDLLLENENRNDRVPIVVLTRKTIEAKMLDQIGEEAGYAEGLKRGTHTMDVYFRPADPTSGRSLKQVNARLAKSIVILADDTVGSRADARSLKCLLAVNSVIDEDTTETTPDGRPWPKPHVVVEIQKHGNYSKFSTFESGSKGRIEIIRGESLRTRILAHAARTPGLVDFYYNLLTHGSETNEFYQLPAGPIFRQIAKDADTVPFRDIALAVLDKGIEQAGTESYAPMIPVGVWRNHRIHLNPRTGSEESKVRETDSLLVIAYQPPEISIRNYTSAQRQIDEAGAGSPLKGKPIPPPMTGFPSDAPRPGRGRIDPPKPGLDH